MKRMITLLAALAIVAPPAVWSQTDELPPEVSLDGLEQVEKTRRKEVYIAPGMDWSVYDSIVIDEATVAFRKNWQRDQNRYQSHRVRTEDMNRIRETMARVFDEVFSKELSENGGFEIVESAGENVLRISPHIVDLDVYAPDPRSAAGIQQRYVETAGRMTLKLELYDSGTGDLLAVGSEHREAPRRGYMQWANTVSNTQQFRLMMQSWARDLRKGLQELQSK